MLENLHSVSPNFLVQIVIILAKRRKERTLSGFLFIFIFLFHFGLLEK